MFADKNVERIFEDRMIALTAGVEAAVAESLAEARRDVAGRLNQAVRRLRSAVDERQWDAALVESTQGFCNRAVLFKILGDTLRFQIARNVDASSEDVPLSAAPAFASAVESKDTVVAIRSVREMSDPIAKVLGDDGRFHLFPIIARDRVTTLLYADAGENAADGRAVDLAALELLATVAGAVYPFPAVDLVHIAADTRHPADLHAQAQRSARVQVAEIRLYKSEQVKNGRIARDLYASLKTEIDSARESFEKDFLSGPSDMVDYLHQELVRTLANDDVQLLGPEYPGPLV
jgi:hypothetical protein